MIDVVWDMETGDPDDFLTLLLLLGHPEVNLKAVTITPGAPDQVGLVRQALAWFNRDIPIGSYNIEHNKRCVSPWHYRVFGEIPISREAQPGPQLLRQQCDQDTVLITGGPLKNLGGTIAMAQMEKQAFKLGRLVVQGGFAGEGVVPSEKQLDKFKGRTTYATYNLNGDPRSAFAALEYPGINVRHFVSKNVCHRVYYDQEMHRRLGGLKDNCLSLTLIWQAMDRYLQTKPEGKKLHDPLAACCAIDESIGSWSEVELFRHKDEWGARLRPGSATWIITDYDHEKFFHVLSHCG
jgi:inosine-uridine nucleoside N-ribohydrolase